MWISGLTWHMATCCTLLESSRLCLVVAWLLRQVTYAFLNYNGVWGESASPRTEEPRCVGFYPRHSPLPG